MISFSDFIYCIACKPLRFFIHSDTKLRISWCHFLENVVYSNEKKAIIKNDFLERKWDAYKICKEHPKKSWKLILFMEELVQAENTQLPSKKTKTLLKI